MRLQELLKDAYKEGMTLEEVEKALEPMTVEDIAAAEIKKHKDARDKAASEAADYKKQLKEKMTEEEKANQELEEMKNELNIIKKNNEVTGKKAELIALGYDEKLAGETATALIEGDHAKVVANQKVFLENQKKKLEADLLKNTPKPGGSGSPPPDDETGPEKLAKVLAGIASTTNKDTDNIFKNYLGGNE